METIPVEIVLFDIFVSSARNLSFGKCGIAVVMEKMDMKSWMEIRTNSVIPKLEPNFVLVHFLLEISFPMSGSIPIKLLHEGEGNTVVIELTNGEKYRGHLVRAEDNMNCQLTHVTMKARDGKLSKLENVFIRGSRVRYVVLPDLLKQSPMFQKVQQLKAEKESIEREKNKQKGSTYLK